ncbi:hypothetical protein GCM10010399_14960 [Dactylosporangium fulvum]|uniref:SnoaL-like domain-containing protein n=1 Tax=Dactylosporangium fulvum TaxID=53359 RepID=A0ABY5VR18_9ACTN|nr:hypothetical protein [Dactylosporangium fulvum]UWP80223.1 hypothetical protein Dfulv_34390 [Dactylosporangium fulvum]
MTTMSQLPIDPMKSLLGIERKRKEITNPKHLHMLDVLEEHVRAELEGDLERIMRTLVPEPEYHFWGSTPQEHFVGNAATRDFYTRIFESGSNQLERTYDRFIIDDYGIFGDGLIKVVVRGALLERLAKNHPGQNIDVHGAYVTVRHSAVIIPFSSDGLMKGEDIYGDERVELIKVE